MHGTLLDMYRVICQDGLSRHDQPFNTRQAADNFAWWGHVCSAHHQVVELREGEVEVGNLYVGDEVLLPGDLYVTVTGFDFSDLHDSPGHVGLMFAGFTGSRLYSTTDLVTRVTRV